MAKKLETLDAEFRKYQEQVVDLIEEGEEEALHKEQETLDSHDDEMADLTIRIKQLIVLSSSSADSSQRKAISHRIWRSLWPPFTTL